MVDFGQRKEKIESRGVDHRYLRSARCGKLHFTSVPRELSNSAFFTYRYQYVYVYDRGAYSADEDIGEGELIFSRLNA